MTKKSSRVDFDSDDETYDPKSQRRPLMKGESIPAIPTLAEQVRMAGEASLKARPGGR
jgi:hypothetical protein